MRLISISTLLDLGYKTRQMNFHRSCSGRNFPLMFHWSFFLLLQAFLYCWYDELGNSSPIHCPVPTTHTTPHLKAVTKWEQNRQDHLQSPIFISAVKIGLATRPPRCPVWLAGRWCGSQCPRPRDQPGAGTCSCIAVLLTHCTLTVLHGVVL